MLYRLAETGLEVLIVHPGGPLWKSRDLGAWSIPKGEFLPGEDPLKTAIREFHEELGQPVSGHFVELTPVKQKAGKTVYPFAVEGDLDVRSVESNTFEMEWPPRSGKRQAFPEVDRAEWVDPKTAKQKLNEAQAAIIDELVKRLGIS